MNNVYLMFVDIKDGVQSNKFYDLVDNNDGTFTASYGRVGSTKTNITYPISKWNSTIKSKIRKGYKDISDLKVVETIVKEASGNKDFDNFFSVFSKYTGDMVRKTYMIEGCSQGQIDEAQSIINKITKIESKKVGEINLLLLELYKVIPRRMTDVRNHLINNPAQKDKIITIEQNALDSMDSGNITNVSNPFKELNIEFSEVTDHKEMEDLLYPTMGARGGYYSRNAKIHKVYRITDIARTKEQNDWLKKQKHKDCQLLIHGTRNPNVFSILKSGLLIRPSNAYFSGAAYGDGIYHSAHSAKSMGYTGGDVDKLFFIQNVHMGNPYTYSGYYRDGKDLSRSNMNYNYLSKIGHDSLFVKPGDGLLNSEYIVYNKEQTNTSFLVWLK